MSKAKNESELVAQNASEDNAVSVVPCSVEEVERHLRAFIAAFVLPQAQSRWIEFLIEKRPQWETPLPKTHPSPRHINMVLKASQVLRLSAIDERDRVLIPNAQRTHEYFDANFGKALGVYFGVGVPPCKMTAGEANTRFVHDDANALLSFQAGKNVLFFSHSMMVWKCQKA